MRRSGVNALVACCIFSLVAVTHTYSGSAAEKAAAKTTAKKTTKKATKSPKKAKMPKKAHGRLPSHYAQIDLSDEQRDTVYDIQSKYREQIEGLRKQLKEIEAKQKEEIDNVLTDDQKKKLAELTKKPPKKQTTKSKKGKS